MIFTAAAEAASHATDEAKLFFVLCTVDSDIKEYHLK
jgi:hypothetical protein